MCYENSINHITKTLGNIQGTFPSIMNTPRLGRCSLVGIAGT